MDSASARLRSGGYLAKIISLGWLPLCLTACVARLSRTYFEVLPNRPHYLLQAPDSRRTPFPEVLKAYNGFEAGRAWIDLEPWMELRVEDAYYEPGAPRTGLAGFLGTEVARYLVRPHGLALVSVHPMANRPNDQPPVQDLISSSKTKFSYYRLYYEIVFSDATIPMDRFYWARTLQQRSMPCRRSCRIQRQSALQALLIASFSQRLVRCQWR